MLETGKLYLWTIPAYRRSDLEKTKLVFCLSSEKVKPIYTRFNLLVMDSNETKKEIVDKFNLEKFLKEFVEVIDEEQVEKARKKMTK